MIDRQVDFILCPAYVGAGVLQGGAKYWNYTAIWNILDMPSCVFPSNISVKTELDKRDINYVPRNEDDKSEWEACKCRPMLIA